MLILTAWAVLGGFGAGADSESIFGDISVHFLGMLTRSRLRGPVDIYSQPSLLATVCVPRQMIYDIVLRFSLERLLTQI